MTFPGTPGHIYKIRVIMALLIIGYMEKKSNMVFLILYNFLFFTKEQFYTNFGIQAGWCFCRECVATCGTYNIVTGSSREEECSCFFPEVIKIDETLLGTKEY